jgi:hypothetical protein
VFVVKNTNDKIGSGGLRDIQMNLLNRKHGKRLAHSFGEATQMCLDHSVKRHNRGSKRVADLIGVKLDTLYKWLSEDRMPMNMIGPFENACGVTYVTEYMCAQAHLLAVEMPTGRKLTQTDIMELQRSFSDAISLLIGFQQSSVESSQASCALTGLMGEIGWHRANVERHSQPDLPMFGEVGAQ